VEFIINIKLNMFEAGTASARSLTYGSMPGSRSTSFSSGTIIYAESATIFTSNEI